MPIVCGFLVLRKPDQNFDEVCQAPYYLPASPPCIKDICYSGISRVSWYELEENYYAGSLPEELIKLREELDEINQPYLDIKLLKDFDKAKQILEYSNTIQDRYELGVVFSEKLSKLKGSLEINLDINWLGFDIYYSGYGSQIKEGIFKKTDLFNDFVDKLNSNGLFDNDKEIIDAYVNQYNGISKTNNLEPMNNLGESLKDLIKVGRVKIS